MEGKGEVKGGSERKEEGREGNKRETVMEEARREWKKRRGRE